MQRKYWHRAARCLLIPELEDEMGESPQDRTDRAASELCDYWNRVGSMCAEHGRLGDLIGELLEALRAERLVGYET